MEPVAQKPRPKSAAPVEAQTCPYCGTKTVVGMRCASCFRNMSISTDYTKAGKAPAKEGLKTPKSPPTQLPVPPGSEYSDGVAEPGQGWQEEELQRRLIKERASKDGFRPYKELFWGPEWDRSE